MQVNCVAVELVTVHRISPNLTTLSALFVLNPLPVITMELLEPINYLILSFFYYKKAKIVFILVSILLTTGVDASNHSKSHEVEHLDGTLFIKTTT